jgi:spore coat polysaccharide biosynthesis protein SpsF
MKRGRTIGVVQARTTSSRLPGKVLLRLGGQPMILRQLERTRRAKTLDEIVVATSDDPSDDELVQVVHDAGYRVVRGPLDDVLGRFTQVVRELHPVNVVRMTADCPLISPAVIDQVVQTFDGSDADYASNTMVPTYPDGLDIEVVTAVALREVAAITTDPHEREHVTLGVYRRPDQFVIENIQDPTGADHSHLRWTVDTPSDFAFVQTVYQHLASRNLAADYRDILALITENPELMDFHTDAARNTALNGLDTGVMQHKPTESY